MKASLAVLLAATLGAVAPSAPSNLSAVQRDLRSLVGAQETYFATHGSYSPDLAALKLTVSDSVTIKLSEYGKNAYSAEGTLKGVEGASCVLMVGKVAKVPKTAGGKAAEAEGAVMCD